MTRPIFLLLERYFRMGELCVWCAVDRIESNSSLAGVAKGELGVEAVYCDGGVDRWEVPATDDDSPMLHPLSKSGTPTSPNGADQGRRFGLRSPLMERGEGNGAV